jgi:hypothetical protein
MPTSGPWARSVGALREQDTDVGDVFFGRLQAAAPWWIRFGPACGYLEHNRINFGRIRRV